MCVCVLRGGGYEYVFHMSAYDIYDMRCRESLNYQLSYINLFLAHVPLLPHKIRTYHSYAYAYLDAVRVLICCAWNGNVRDAISKLTRLIFCCDNH